ncbi:hypothetical protein M2387_001039 [Klebsiella sp. BIGb0407]|nr:hypothetical protein [Klebsiella sp. BIGb0407]
MNDSEIEFLKLIFCSSERVGYDAPLSPIGSSSAGTTAVNAVQYSPMLCQDDYDIYPRDII